MTIPCLVAATWYLDVGLDRSGLACSPHGVLRGLLVPLAVALVMIGLVRAMEAMGHDGRWSEGAPRP